LGVGVDLDGCSDALLLGGVQPRALAVVLLDASFDSIGPLMPGHAAGAQIVPVEAAEVLVAAAVASNGSEHEPSAALAAEDRTLEVVLVLVAAVAAQRMAS
jgi:hypothetical protein